jgi:hypothetical protein
MHRPVGEEHIDFTQGIKVKCVRIDDGRKGIFQIRPDEASGTRQLVEPSVCDCLTFEIM